MPNPTCPHCGTAIEEHEAGRCLDWWVFEAVICDEPLSDANREVLPQAGVPRYSTDIAAAWEVVEKMNSRGFWSDASRDPTGYVCCTFDSGKRMFMSPKKTKDMPLAICRAAIMAMQEEKT